MQTIDEKIKGLQDEINLWAFPLWLHMDRLQQLEVEDFKTYLLGERADEEEVSAEFALEALLSARGRLMDVVLASENFWPHRKGDFKSALPYPQSHPERVVGMLKEKLQSDDSGYWSIHLIENRTEHFDEVLSQDYPLDPKELFTMAHRWRRALCKAAVLDSPLPAVTEKLMGDAHWGSLLHERVQRLPFRDRKIFVDAIRRYLSSEYLFPWLSDKYSFNVLQYGNLFRLAQIEERTMQEHDEALWDELFGDVELNHNTRGIVAGIIKRIGDALRQIGNYDKLVDQILSSGGSWGPDSIVGSPGEVNLIPSDDMDGSCRQIVLAFAKGKGPLRFRLINVMRQVREHLIRCGDSACRNYESTRIAVVFTDLWDQKIFAESVGDLRAHHDSPPGKVIIGVLVNKDRITFQPII